MKNITIKKTLKLCALSLTSFALAAQAETTVGVLNPNSIAFINSPLNVGNASFVTAASMATLMTGAFSGNSGGVVNFEVANGWANVSLTNVTLSYGVSQSQSLTMNELQPFPGSFSSQPGVGTTPTSGTQFIGFGNNTTPTFSFSTGLSEWGMFLINRGATRTAGFTFTLADATTITYAADTQTSGGPAVWFGVQALASNPIMSLQVTGTGGNFTRWDDMAFIVAPAVVPEPATLTLLGLGSLLGVVTLRRRNK